jgi:hypothetical protein
MYEHIRARRGASIRPLLLARQWTTVCFNLCCRTRTPYRTRSGYKAQKMCAHIHPWFLNSMRVVQSMMTIYSCLIARTIHHHAWPWWAHREPSGKFQIYCGVFIHCTLQPHTNGLGSCATCIVLLLAIVCRDIRGSVFVKRFPPFEFPDSVR